MRYLLPLFALCVFGAVDGTVRNGSTGKPQAGATVTIYQVGAGGPEPIESVKTDAAGAWKIDKPFNGRGFIQTAFDGVTYNHTLRPGGALTGIALTVYATSKQRGKDVVVTNHMMLLEPQGDKLSVRESYFFQNDGKTTWNDSDNGTLRFRVHAEPLGPVEVNATAPQGMPIRRAADKGASAGEMKVDFPIKPGETRMDLSYTVPYASPAKIPIQFVLSAQQRMIAVPRGVELAGDGLKSEGKEPTTQASIFRVEKDKLDLTMTGAGELQPEEGSKGPSIEQIKARPYDKLYPILGIAFAILAIGGAMLYRSEAGK
jgi:hypothetical protein